MGSFAVANSPPQIFIKLIMPNYRRFYASNTYYFFTVVTYKRRPIFQNESAINLLKQTIKTIKNKHPFGLEAIVILPEHIHSIWQMPDDDIDYSLRWQLIKMRFTKLSKENINNHTMSSSSRIHKREQTIWQRRFWEHRIRNEKDFERHFDYIHYNPVKHGYVNNPKDWQWSTFHKYVNEGWYDEDWGNSEPTALMKTCAGE